MSAAQGLPPQNAAAPSGAPSRAEPASPPDPNRRIRTFISYRREDSSGQAGRLYDSLSEYFGSQNVFMDLDTIGPGEDFVEVIDEALQNCECVLVVIGPRWLQAEREGQRRLDDPADYLRIEVEHSLARAPRVIPVLVQGAAMPRSRDLPEAIRTLARRNAFDLSDSRWRLDVQRLIDALENIEATLGIRAPATALAATASAPAMATTPTATATAMLEAAQPTPALPPDASVRAGLPPPSADPSRRSPATTPPVIVLPPWVPGWAAQRIGPIVAVLALVVVVALGAYFVVALGAYFVAKGGSASPTFPIPTFLADASGTPIPFATGTPQPTPQPTSLPTSTGAGASTEPRTPAPPSSGPTAQPTPVRVLPAGIGLGTDTMELDETFTNSGSFPVSSDERGSFAYAGGGFDISVISTNYSLWSPHVLPAAHAVIRARASITVGSDGATGSLMCGNASPDYLYGGVGRDNRWVIGTIVSNSIQTLESGTIPVAAQVPPGTALDVRLECAVTGASSDRMQLIIGGIKVADNSAAPRVGPFSRVAMLASSATVSPATVHFDNLSTWSGAAFRESTEKLRDHVPSLLASHCRPTPENGVAGQVAALLCSPAGAIDQAEYYQFDTSALMTKQFLDTIRTSGSTATGTNCAIGPSNVRYNDAAGIPAGSLACFPNTGTMGGLLILWTNESLDILSAGIDASGTYADIATWWNDAGPIP